MTSRSFEVLAVGSPLHDARALRRALEPSLRALVSLGGREAGEAALTTADPLAVLVGTGGTEAEILRLHAARQAAVPGDPLLLVTHPAHNSLPAALEALARLRQDGARGRIVHLPGPDDGPALARLSAAIDDLRAFRRLHRSRIGLVGAPSDWLVASVPAAEAVRRTWGPETVAVDLDGVLEAAGAAAGERATALAASFGTGATATREPTDDAVRQAAGVFGALEDLTAGQRLDAVAVRCFDLVTRRGTSGCLALAELNDRGTVAACEGDLASAVAMLWVRELLGTASWMANPVHADPGSGLLRLAHCTIPRSLVTSFELRSHFESGKGVALAGQLPPGPATLLRRGGRGLEQAFIAEGEAVPASPREDLCRTQVDVTLAAAEVAELLARPLGNHLVLVPGRSAARLRDYRDWAVAA
jgi:L-fucose isomerase-like protein